MKIKQITSNAAERETTEILLDNGEKLEGVNKIEWIVEHGITPVLKITFVNPVNLVVLK